MELLAVDAPCLLRSGWACDPRGPAHVLNQTLFLSLLDLGSSGLPNLPQPVPLPPGQPANYGALHSLCPFLLQGVEQVSKGQGLQPKQGGQHL